MLALNVSNFPFVLCAIDGMKVHNLEDIFETSKGKKILENEAKLRWAFDNDVISNVIVIRPSKVCILDACYAPYNQLFYLPVYDRYYV